MSNTTFQTKDQVYAGASREPQGFNPINAGPAGNQKGNKKSKGHELWICPLEKLPNFSKHSLEVASQISELGKFKEEEAILEEQHVEKKNNHISLPQNGMHDDTPYNMHHTNSFSLGSHAWLPPVQNQERQANVYYQKHRHFLSQYNMNSSNLDADLNLGQPQSHFGLEVDTFIAGYYPIADSTTATLSDSLLNMNDVFEV